MKKQVRTVTVALILLVSLASYVMADMRVEKTARVSPLTPRECQLMMKHHTFLKDNPVACKRLSAVDFDYLSDGGILKNNGHLVVLDVIAPQTAELMDKLLEEKFYIHKARPMEEYDGDDVTSMNDNNSSAFNSRPIIGTSRWSLHSYGVAIDINPLQNPVIYPNQQEGPAGEIVPGKPGTAFVRPEAATNPDDNYINRNVYRARADDKGFFRPGMAEMVVGHFADYGFLTWGAYWNDPLDYQHFEVGPTRFIERLYAADPATTTNPVNGRLLFAEYREDFRRCLENQKLSPSSEDSASRTRAFCAREITDRYQNKPVG